MPLTNQISICFFFYFESFELTISDAIFTVYKMCYSNSMFVLRLRLVPSPIMSIVGHKIGLIHLIVCLKWRYSKKYIRIMLQVPKAL